MRIAIVEDDERDMEQLRDVVDAYAGSRDIPVRIDTFSSGPDFLKAFAPKKYALVFFDNYIGTGLGIDFARRAREQDAEVEFAFVSMSPEFAVSGFEVRALHYIIKPATPEAIATVFDRLWNHTQKPENPMIEVVSDYRPVLIPARSIRYINIEDKICIIHADSDVRVHMQLEKLMELLPPNEFVRTHRSYAVRLDCIKTMNPNGFELKDGVSVPIGRAYQSCRSAYIEYFADHGSSEPH